jgi:hypothetical protein
MNTKKDILYQVIGIIIGAFLLVLLSAIQKYILFGKIIFTLKGYIIPIIFGGVTGGIISLFFIKLLALNETIRIENQELNKRNEEIESLYSELEVHSQTIDELNHNLNNVSVILKETLLLISN